MLDNNQLFRVNGYSTDGFFLIKTELENSILKRKLTSEDKPSVTSIVNRAINNQKKELFLSPDITFMDGCNLKVYKLIADKHDVYVDAKFLKYFKPFNDLTFYQDHENNEWFDFSPVVVKRNGEFIGVIMPIRQG
mgnify:FL=1